MEYYTYILASKHRGTLYIGVTSDLIRRVYEHRNKLVRGFTNKYSVNMLVYYEECSDVQTAIKREKQLRAWRRSWKVDLIEKENSRWEDLYQTMI